MIDCPIHGICSFQLGCMHFTDGVDAQNPIHILERWNADGTPFMLCDACAAQVDAARGSSDPNLHSNIGMDPHAVYVGCCWCTIEAYEKLFERFSNDQFIQWFRKRNSEQYIRMAENGFPPKGA